MSVTSVLAKLRNGEFDFRSFYTGVSCAVAFYVLFFLYAAINGQKTVEGLEARLASQTVTIEKASAVAKVKRSVHKKKLPGVALTKAPVEGLYETTRDGPLPVIRQRDKMTSFRAYKRPYKIASIEKPAIAVLVADFGISSRDTEAALETLPPDVSFLLSPYADNPTEWQEKARDAGHEIWLNLRMGNPDFPRSDAGPASLLFYDSLQKNQSNMHWVMSRTSGYAGVASFSDDSFLKAKPMLETLVEEIFSRGLGFLELNPDASSEVVDPLSLAKSAPYLRADHWVQEPEKENVFAALEKTARDKGFALGLVSLYPTGLKGLNEWVHMLQDKGFILIPVSAVYDAPLYAKRTRQK